MDVQQFQEIIQNGINHHAVRPDNNLYSSKALATNNGLYTAMTVFLNSIITNLDNIRDLGNEIGTEDEESAQKSKQQFIKILHSKALKDLSSSSDKQVRIKLLKLLQPAKNFFYQVSDKTNPAYHNKAYRPIILKYDGQVKYLDNDKLEDYIDARNLINKETKLNNQDQFTKSLIKDAIDEFNDSKVTAKKILSKFGLQLNNNNYKLDMNPKVSDYTNSPRVVTINNIKFFYNPKDVSLQQILDNNIPELPNDQDSFFVSGVYHHSIEEY